MRIYVHWVLLVAALLFSTSCGSSDDLENPDPIYLVLDGSTSISFENDEQRSVDVLEATSSDPTIVRIDGVEDGYANFTGLAEGDTNIELRTKNQHLTAKIHVRAPDRFELYGRSYPWPPCERFAPGAKETGSFEWYRKEQKLEGVRFDTVFESSNPAVATVSYDWMGQATISYLKPGNVSVTAEGIEGPSRRVVAVRGQGDGQV